MADIPMLQGWYDQLAPGLQNISEGIANLINPNRLAQQQLKAEIARNPETLQQLSDAEALNPGSVSRVFGNAATAILGAPSAATQNEMDLRGGASVADLQNSDSARKQLLLRGVTGANKNENIVQGNNATRSSAQLPGDIKEAQLKEKDTDVQLGNFDARTKLYLTNLRRDQTKADSEIQSLSNKIDNYPAIKGMNFSKLAAKAARGQLSPQEAQQVYALQSDDVAANTFKSLVDGYQHADDLSMRWAVHQQSKASENTLLRRQAFQLARDLEVPGDVDAVMAYLDKPEAAQLARDLADGKKKPQSQLEEGLMRVEQANRKLVAGMDTEKANKAAILDIRQRAERSQAAAHVVNSIDKINNKLSGDERTAAVAQVNQDLATLTGGRIQYIYEDKFGWDNSEFVDTQTSKKIPKKLAEQFMFNAGGPEQKIQGAGGDAGAVANVAGSDASANAGRGDPVAAWRNLDSITREKKLKQLPANQAAAIRAALASKK